MSTAALRAYALELGAPRVAGPTKTLELLGSCPVRAGFTEALLLGVVQRLLPLTLRADGLESAAVACESAVDRATACEAVRVGARAVDTLPPPPSDSASAFVYAYAALRLGGTRGAADAGRAAARVARRLPDGVDLAAQVAIDAYNRA